jgi:ATP-binding protein involved in chromosome partitioning
MAAITQALVEAALKEFQIPYLKKDLISSKVVQELFVKDNHITLTLQFGFPCQGYHAPLSQSLQEFLSERLGTAVELNLSVTSKITAHAVQRGVSPIEGIKNIIAVASGKGGVGKSTTAVNLALALVAEGAKVGILDADIYGPSQPRMLGAKTQPESKDGTHLEPVVSHGLQSMSIGYLIDDETPMIWRGPMVTQALEQLLKETRWTDLDYLVIDLPPGTGDTQLTLAQKIPVSGAVIVTTPQDIALLDARKGLKMFEKVNVPVLGIVENMSIHICSKCGHAEHIFGSGGGTRMSEDYNVELLGELPLDIRIREDADGGIPTVVAAPDSLITASYREIARRVAAKLSLQAKDYSAKFPKITIQNN